MSIHSLLRTTLVGVWLLSGAAAIAAEAAPGLSIRGDDVLLAGKPFHGIGANYFSLFYRLLHKPDDTSSLTNLAALHQANIPFVRFMCGGFWPNEQRLYLTNREAFFQRLDRVVRSAEENHVGLVPSLFWNLPTTPDLMGEPMQELGNPNSKSVALIRRYTADVVGRYKDSPAIWAWEFGNECNLGIDLPNAKEHRPSVAPQLGTPAVRTERDELHFEQLSVAFGVFSETVRTLDPRRVILSGNSLPRASAWHNVYEKSWKADSREQFREMLHRDNPDPMDVLSVHIYPNHDKPYVADVKGIDGIVTLMSTEAKLAHKPLFIGEFGAERQLGTVEQQRTVFAEFLSAIEKERVPLSAFWVFDLPSQDKDWNVTFQNDRSFMIELVGQANARLQAASKP